MGFDLRSAVQEGAVSVCLSDAPAFNPPVLAEQSSFHSPAGFWTVMLRNYSPRCGKRSPGARLPVSSAAPVSACPVSACPVSLGPAGDELALQPVGTVTACITARSSQYDSSKSLLCK